MLKQKNANNQGSDDNVATKSKDKRVIRIVILKPSGAKPDLEEVRVDEDNHFTLKHHSGLFTVSQGSTWTEGGTTRALVNPQNPQTINAALCIDPIMHPKIYESDLENNLAVQVTSVARKKPVWQQGMAWGMGIMGIILMGLMLWGVMSLSDGFDSLTNALQGIQASSGQVGAAGAAQQAGHQSIAPR